MVKQAVDAPQLDRQEFAIARTVFVEEPAFNPAILSNAIVKQRWLQPRWSSSLARTADAVTQQLRHEYPVQHGKSLESRTDSDRRIGDSCAGQNGCSLRP